MTDTASNTNSNQGWSAGIGAALGAVIGENGFLGGNKTPGVTPDQMNQSLNNLAAGFQRESLGDKLDLLGAGSAAGFASVTGAVTGSASQNALSLCGLGNTIAQGFAATNFNIQEQASKGRELALEQSNLALRDQLTEARIRLSEAHNAAQHTTTQVLINQVLAK